MLGQLRRLGANVVGDVWKVCISARIGSDWEERMHWAGLQAASAQAEALGAVLVAESGDRYVRGRDFDLARPFDTGIPTVADYARLFRFIGGRRPATILHPDAPPREVRGEQTKRGHEASGNKGGRPPNGRKVGRPPGDWTEQFLSAWLPRMRELRKEGQSDSAIAQRVSRESGERITRPSVTDWLSRIRQGGKFPSRGKGGRAPLLP